MFLVVLALSVSSFSAFSNDDLDLLQYEWSCNTFALGERGLFDWFSSSSRLRKALIKPKLVGVFENTSSTAFDFNLHTSFSDGGII